MASSLALTSTIRRWRRKSERKKAANPPLRTTTPITTPTTSGRPVNTTGTIEAKSIHSPIPASDDASRPTDVRHALDPGPLGQADVAIRNEDGPPVAGQAVRPRAVIEVADSMHRARSRIDRKRDSAELVGQRGQQRPPVRRPRDRDQPDDAAPEKRARRLRQQPAPAAVGPHE